MDVEELLRANDPARLTLDAWAEEDLASIIRTGPVRRGMPQPARWAIALAAVAAVIGALVVLKPVATPTPQFDYPSYSTSQELEAAASLVVVGEVLSERPHTEQGFSYDVFSVRVESDALGRHDVGSTVEVKVMSGNVAERGPELVVGGRYILFAEEYDESPASLLNPWQGAYELRDESIVANPDNPVRLDADLLRRLGLD